MKLGLILSVPVAVIAAATATTTTAATSSTTTATAVVVATVLSHPNIGNFALYLIKKKNPNIHFSSSIVKKYRLMQIFPTT